jgi:hypothetical protein
VEEVHRVRVAAVLAADAELQVRPGGPAFPTAMSTRRPTPSRSIVSNGDTPKMPSSMYLLKNAPSTSSREKPQVIWVRSLVPKEKNSALAAIGPAFSAALGTSIMVPIGVCTWVPVSASTSRATFSAARGRSPSPARSR